jgi:hypothetical protein
MKSNIMQNVYQITESIVYDKEMEEIHLYLDRVSLTFTLEEFFAIKDEIELASQVIEENLKIIPEEEFEN